MPEKGFWHCCLSSRPLSVSSDAQRCKSYLTLPFGSFLGRKKTKHPAACWHHVRHADHSFFPWELWDCWFRAFPKFAPAVAPAAPATARALHPAAVSAVVPSTAVTVHIAAPQGAASASASQNNDHFNSSTNHRAA